MGSILKKITGAKTGTGRHAHLLVAEMAGKPALENPEAVMDEVEFRATYISVLMERMFLETLKKNEWERDEG